MKIGIKAAVFATLFAVSTAFAGDWQQDHPRRAEVNDRLKNQNRRINEGEASGKITPGQAKQLHQEDHAIRQQERADAAAHGGHITKGEQHQLNREENQTSQQIYDEKH
jgi:hypothetical protein